MKIKLFLVIAVTLSSIMSCSREVDLVEEEKAQLLETVLLQFSEDFPQVVLLPDSHRLDDGGIVIDTKERFSEAVFPYFFPFHRSRYKEGQIRISSDWRFRDGVVSVEITNTGSDQALAGSYSFKRESFEWVSAEEILYLLEISGCSFEDE